jgi:ribosome biogenesis protein Nip4
LRTQNITNDLKDVIMNIINNKFNQKEYNLLTSKDKQIVKAFVKIFKYDLTIHDDEDIKFSNDFNVLLGEYEAGNDNEEIKKNLKKFVKIAMIKKLITNREGMELLFDLS